MTKLRIGHYSLYHGADADKVARGLVKKFVTKNLTAMTTTEAQQKKIKKKVKKQLKVYYHKRDVRVVKRNQYLFIIRRDKIKGNGKVRLRRLTKKADNGIPFWRQTRMATVPCRVAGTNEKFDLSSIHFISGVEMGSHFRKGKERYVHMDATQEAGIIISRRRRKGHKHILGYDGNLNQKLKVWLNYFNRNLGIDSCWTDIHPNRGTHGKTRTIDAISSHYEAEVAYVDAIPVAPGVDHYGVVVNYEV